MLPRTAQLTRWGGLLQGFLKEVRLRSPAFWNSQPTCSQILPPHPRLSALGCPGQKRLDSASFPKFPSRASGWAHLDSLPFRTTSLLCWQLKLYIPVLCAGPVVISKPIFEISGKMLSLSCLVLVIESWPFSCLLWALGGKKIIAGLCLYSGQVPPPLQRCSPRPHCVKSPRVARLREWERDDWKPTEGIFPATPLLIYNILPLSYLHIFLFSHLPSIYPLTLNPDDQSEVQRGQSPTHLQISSAPKVVSSMPSPSSLRKCLLHWVNSQHFI